MRVCAVELFAPRKTGPASIGLDCLVLMCFASGSLFFGSDKTVGSKYDSFECIVIRHPALSRPTPFVRGL